jgi:AraC-like DNA-binding protein
MLLDPFLKSRPPNFENNLTSCEAFFWIYLTSGTMKAKIAGTVHHLHPHQCLILPRGCSAELSTPSKQGYNGVSFTILPPEESHWPIKEASVLRASTNLQNLAEILEKSLEAPTARPMEFCRLIARALLLESKTCLMQNRTQQLPSLEESTLSKIEEDLRRSVYSTETISEILAKRGTTIRQAQRLFQKHHGVSAKTWQLEQKIKASKDWLSRKEISITTIARELGFTRSQHFASAFRKHEGRSPTEWRVEKK